MNSSLNHVYRVVWNATLGLWQVASEMTRNGGKTQSEQRKRRRVAVQATAVSGAIASLALPSIGFAQLPTGGQVVGGQASIVQSGNALNITQSTDRAAIDWQTFNVGQGNTVNFNQPSASAIALNRVLGSDVSVIQGAINANGQVFLVNQNGILFTPTAQVNVGGIVASTQSISTADFMAGKYTFSGNSTGSITNQGNITTSNGGTVALIAAKIINTGNITAPLGTVGLAAGNTVTLDLGGPVKIQVTEGALNSAIEQGGGIVADGGQVYLTAKAAGDLASSVINHTGITRARTLAHNQKGKIIAIADMNVGTTTVAGTLDASAPSGGDGGFIETSAATVKIQDGVNITTQSTQGNNGQWLIDPHDFTIAATGGDITGAALGTALQNNSVTIQTQDSSVSCTGATCGTGKADGNGDIFVNDNVIWSSSSKLTLRANRNIAINKTITASGATGSLALEYGQSSMSGNGADYFIAADAKVNLQTGQNFSTKQGNGSSTRVFTVITALGAQGSTTGTDLQGISGNQAGNYALGADIDASATSGWESGQGFSPIFSFTGRFDGLGHKISNLTINRPTTSNGVGLFRNLSAGAVVQHLGLTNVSIAGSGTTGGIVGFSLSGLIRRSYTTGSISCVNGIQCGGILGLQQGATLQSVYSSASVSSSDTAGGLVGRLDGGSISDSYATGNISTVDGATGGLVGWMQDGTVTRSFATGKVTSGDPSNDGGLVGLYFGGTITASFWDTQTSMTNNGIGTAGVSTTGFLGRSTADMQKIATYQAAGWNISGKDGSYPILTFSSDSTWRIGPTTTPIFIRLDCGLCESIYGETPQFSFKAFTAANGGTAVTDAMLTGTALYSLTNGGTAAGTELGRLTDAGTYAVTYTSGLTGASMYQLSAGAATNFTIKPKLLTVAIQAAVGSPVSKVYDGNQDIALSANNFVISGFVDQQGAGASVSGVTTGTFNNANVAQANTITAELGQNSIVLPQTAKAGNYTLPTTASGAGTITPKALSITTNEFVSSATANAAIANTDGLVAGQSVSALNLDGKNLSVAFGENTLASNYATTVVVPGAAGADLAVNRDLSLASGLSLTLRSDKNIVVNKVIDATAGPGSKVTLEFGQGAVAEGNTAEYVMNLVDTTFNGKINLLKGQNFATKQGSDGQLLNYTVITELGEQGSTTGTDLQGINGGVGSVNLAGRYVLGADIDATVTNTWNVNNQGVAQGFNPIYTPLAGRRPNVIPAVPFSGTFDGLGHTVNNFTINREGTEFVGLFGQSTGQIRHVGLSGGSVKGNLSVGALVGQQSGGSIAHVYSTANVSGTSSVGGLVGALQNAGSVGHARSGGVITGRVTANDGQNVLGGLIGSVATGSTVAHSHASGSVDAPNSRLVGGLVGSVLGASTLTDVSATGHVTGRSDTGGLVGSLVDSTLRRAFASGAVNGPAIFDLTTTFAYGGLVGAASNSTISDVFATGAVNAGALRDVGGLVGIMGGGSLTNGYATGAVMGTARVGSLIGLAGGSPTLSNSFWNTQTTGRDNAVGSGDLNIASAGNVGKTTAQLQNAFTFIDAGWNFETVWGKSIAGANGGNMQLRSLTNDNFDDYVRVAGSSKVYGTANSTITGASLSGVGVANVTASVGSAVGELSDAGEYLYSTENVLNVTNKVAGRSTFVDRSGKLIITPKALTVALQGTLANPLTKVYNGNDSIALSSGNFALTGFVGQQGVGATLGGVTSGTFNSKNVLEANTVSASLGGATLSGTAQGFKSSNYSLPTGPLTAAGTITPKGIAVTGLAAQNKTYDGNRNAVITGTAVVDTTGVIQGDIVNVAGTAISGLFADKDAGTDKAVSVSGLSLSGTDAGNYAIAPANLKANIAQKQLTVSGFTVANKTYDGNVTATITNSGTLDGVVSADTAKVTLSNTGATFDTKDAGTGKTVTLNGKALTGDEAKNYVLASDAVTVKADIARKAITLTGFDADNKVYDGTTTATIINAGSLTGVIQDDSVTVSNNGATFDNRNAGTGKTVTLNGVQLSGTHAGNYSIASTATDTADITRRGGVTVTLQNQTKNAGAADPLLTFTATGLLEGDSLSGAASRVAGEAVGTYTISGGTLGNPNYEIETVTPAQLEIRQPITDSVIATVSRLPAQQNQTSGAAPAEPQSDRLSIFVPQGQAVNTGPAQIVVVQGGININAPTLFGLVGTEPGVKSPEENQ